MDELAKALAEAVRAGAHIAGPALVGYYTVRVAETLFPVIGWIVTVVVAGRTVVLGIKTGMSYSIEANRAAIERYNAWRTARNAGYGSVE